MGNKFRIPPYSMWVRPWFSGPGRLERKVSDPFGAPSAHRNEPGAPDRLTFRRIGKMQQCSKGLYFRGSYGLWHMAERHAVRGLYARSTPIDQDNRVQACNWSRVKQEAR
jgi:hypothetical protein